MTISNASTVAQPCVNQSECSGCQACVEMYPEVFQWDDQDERILILCDAADTELIEQAMAYCPNDCIEMDVC